MNSEQLRLIEARDKQVPWRKWGPYLSERQWGTVREDYSRSGDAWNYFPHDHARSRAYLWGEDGLAGISDEKQRLCLALALWNGKDPILKERLFGLTNGEGNHGEDVKEYYFYLDSTPTHSYMKYLYKYPQEAYPYLDLVKTNRKRSRNELEYELIDTGIFNKDRYFDVFVEYAKATPEDILVRITVWNRGPEEAKLHILPTLWFRNNWAWAEKVSKPLLRTEKSFGCTQIIRVSHLELGELFFCAEGEPELLFTENETSCKRIFGTPNTTPYVKDAFHNYIINGQEGAVNPEKEGTKAAAHYTMILEAGKSAILRLRLVNYTPEEAIFSAGFDVIMEKRLREADDFYGEVSPSGVSLDEANVMRQALAGMLWTKQFYYYDVDRWLKEHHAHPLYPSSRPSRNRDWFHMLNENIISVPDKWEYPWYAAWDLPVHAIALSVVDPDFAKEQLEIMLSGFYLHPNGQIPAYEWNFGDANPPAHAWATLFLHLTEKATGRKEDFKFLRLIFQKLLLNFTWWVNRKDRFGRNVFEGGFLGLDNIGFFDRSSPLPTGGYLEQADVTAWMALFCQNMVELSVELASQDPVYDDMVEKFLEHFLWIAAAINRPDAGMWDEEDGFYYDVLRLPDGSSRRLKVRSMFGLLPLCATTVTEKWQRDRVISAVSLNMKRLQKMPELAKSIHPTGPGHFGVAERSLFSLLNPESLRRVLSKMLDEEEFLSPYGIRSLSKFHLRHPYIFRLNGQEYRVDYQPAESNTGTFGGNSNWRGPIWFPVNALIIRALLQFHMYYGDGFRIECPTGSGKMMNLLEVAKEIGDRLTRIFLRDEKGGRPVYGGTEKFQTDPYWRDYILFYEYFHGDNGAGVGASHQTGWTGLVANIIQLFSLLDSENELKAEKWETSKEGGQGEPED
ncbi:MGH1-like glycoside hydrolase domain-containing protein [Methanosarcina sp. T3]|uniref:MGH1-like glycoside hydrolase domain-containing protein n=1 Tax=Methanosarcina sp. T3 TaxID=3439062 RepID=UPI003F87D0F8